jgi:hypothetical protein
MIIPDPAASGREEAERQSRHCPVCEGRGLATLYRDGYRGHAAETIEDPERGRRQIVMRIMAHCVCALGRWMRARTDDEMRRRIPDLNVIGDGQYPWSLEDPSLDAQARFHSARDWRQMLRSIGRKPVEAVVEVTP